MLKKFATYYLVTIVNTTILYKGQEAKFLDLDKIHVTCLELILI